METLIDLLKKTLADSFCFYLKAHNFHWNVEGMFFKQLHDFFGDLYEEVHDSIDPLAEEIRTLDAYVPGSLKRYQDLTEIEDQLNVPKAQEMIAELLSDNEIIIQDLNIVFKLANELDKQGLADFIAGRIDAHSKHEWMLKSFLK